MAWAKHAAGRGLTLEQIKDELLDGRDLSKKGSGKRQFEYAERTARKVIDQMMAGKMKSTQTGKWITFRPRN